MEDTKLEYKRQINYEAIDKGKNNNLIYEIIAFLNMLGGELYIGVDDDGTVVGISDYSAECEKLESRIRDKIRPSSLGLISFKREMINDRTVLKISISEGNSKPYYDIDKGMTPNGVFIRHGSSKEKASQDWIDEKLFSRSLITLKNTISHIQELTFEELKNHYKNILGKDLEDFNFRINLDFCGDQGFNKVGYLFSDQFVIDYSIMEIIDDKDFRVVPISAKSLFGKFLEVEQLIKKYYSTEFINSETLRRDSVFNVDFQLIREVLVNAFVHADYINFEKLPQIKISNENIQIISYGKSNVSKEEFLLNVSFAKNREIMRIFKDLKYVEEFGIGSKIMNANSNVEVLFLDNTVSVNIPTSNNIKPVKLDILSLINDGISTRKELEKVLSKSDSYVKKELKKLVDDGKIVKVGAGKSTYYQTVDKFKT